MTNFPRLLLTLLILTLPACATSQTRVALTIRNGEPEISITTFPPPQIVTREAIGLETTHATQSAQIAAQ